MPNAAQKRGFSLLFVAAMLVVLSMGAGMLLSQVTDTGMLMGSQIRQTKNDNCASAGVAYALTILKAKLYAFEGAPMDLTALQNMPSLGANDPICADGIDCTRWHLLARQVSVGSGGETASLAVACNPNCGADPDQIINFQVRALASLGNSSAIMEAFLVPGQ